MRRRMSNETGLSSEDCLIFEDPTTEDDDDDDDDDDEDNVRTKQHRLFPSWVTGSSSRRRGGGSSHDSNSRASSSSSSLQQRQRTKKKKKEKRFTDGHSTSSSSSSKHREILPSVALDSINSILNTSPKSVVDDDHDEEEDDDDKADPRYGRRRRSNHPPPPPPPPATTARFRSLLGGDFVDQSSVLSGEDTSAAWMTCYSNHHDDDDDHTNDDDNNDDVASIITAHSSQDVALDKVWTHVSHHGYYNNNNNHSETRKQDPTSSLDSDNNNGSSDEVEEIVFVSDNDDDDDDDEPQPVEEEEEGEEVFMDPVGDMGLGGEPLLFKTTTTTNNNNNKNNDEKQKTLFPPSRVFRSGRYRTKENSVSLDGVLEPKANTHNSMDPRTTTTTTTTTMFAWRQDDFVHPAIPNEIMLNLSEEEEVLPTKGGGPPSRATTETGTASSYSISPTNSREESTTTNNNNNHFIPRKKFALYSSYLQKSSKQQMILVDHITPDSSVQSLDNASKSEMESSCSDEFDTPVVKSSTTTTSKDGAFPYHNVNNYDDDDEEKVLVRGGAPPNNESLRNSGCSDTSQSAATTPAETTPPETARGKRGKKKKKKQQRKKGWEKFAGRIGMKATFCLVVFLIFLVCLLMVVGIVVLGQHVEFSLDGISPEELGPTPQPTWRFPTPAPQPLPTTPSPVVVAAAPSPTPPPNLRGGSTPSPTVAATTTAAPLWSHTGLIMRRPFNFTALALSDNGRVMAVTAENTTVSRVRVWHRQADNRSNNGWMPRGQPLDETRLVAVGGAPGAPTTSLWRRSSALSKDGTRLCILTLRHENADKIQGTVQVYHFVNATSLWSLEETLNPKASRDTDMVLSGNGETIVVTNLDDNKQPLVVYGLETDKMKWKEQKPAVSGIGGQGSVVTRVSISHHGTVLAVQHNTAAATHLVIRVLRFEQATGWVALGQDVSTTQGGLMALSSSDGTTLAVAANTTSSSSATTMNGMANSNVAAIVYRYSPDTDLWQVQSHDSISGSGDLLSAMALSANGNVLATVASSATTTNGTSSSSSLPILVHSFAVAQSRWTRMGSGLHHVGLPTTRDYVHLALSGDGRSLALATTGGIQTWEQS